MSRGEKRIALEDGPYDGMIDSRSPGAKAPGKYYLGQNVYPGVGGTVIGRPGRTRMNATPFTGTAQAIFQFSVSNVERSILITGGKVYQYDWTTSTFTENPTTATLTAHGVTISNAVPFVYVVQLRDKVVVSDGVNAAWTWDGTAASITPLTNAPIFKGKPAFYLGRIFGIKAQPNDDTIVWSETDSFNTGYEAGGFNNAWRVTQSNPGVLTALHADNEGLTLFRARAATRVYGEDPQEFVTGSTLDALDETEGTRSPACVIPVHGTNVLVLDADLKPHLVRPSSAGFTPLWEPFEETITASQEGTSPNFSAPFCQGVYFPPTDLALIVLSVDLGTFNDSPVLVYDCTGAPRAVAVWTGWGYVSQIGVWTNGTTARSGERMLITTDDAGYVYLHGADVWDDAGPTGALGPIEHVLESQPLGYTTQRNKIFDVVTIAGGSDTVQTLEVSLTAPERSQAAEIVSIPIGPDDRKVDVGTDAEGRWARVRIRHQTLGEQFGVSALTVSAVVADLDPVSP